MRKPTPFHDDIYKNMEYPQKELKPPESIYFSKPPTILKTELQRWQQIFSKAY